MKRAKKRTAETELAARDAKADQPQGELEKHRAEHGDAAVAEVYAEVLGAQQAGLTLGAMAQLPAEIAPGTGKAMMQNVVQAVAPRDPLERMLVEQLVLCHHRVLALSALSGSRRGLEVSLAANAHCDRAMNSYRRGMLALKEYRSRRGTTPTVSVQQVNQAEHQNVTVAVASSPERKT